MTSMNTLQVVVKWESDSYLLVVRNVMEYVNATGDRGEQGGRNQAYSRRVVYRVITVLSVT